MGLRELWLGYFQRELGLEQCFQKLEYHHFQMLELLQEHHRQLAPACFQTLEQLGLPLLGLQTKAALAWWNYWNLHRMLVSPTMSYQ